MMHIYVCEKCKKAYMVSRRKQASCRCCGGRMTYCQTEFIDWVDMTDEQRKIHIDSMCKRVN